MAPGGDRRPGRRLLGLLTVGVLLGSSLAACTTTQEDGELIVLSGRDASVNRQRAGLIDEWNEDHSPKARFVEVGPIADQQHNEMIKDAQAARPSADVYNLDVTWTAEFAAAGYIRPLPDLGPDDTSDFILGPLDSGRYENVLYALPFNTDAGLMFYRTDLLANRCPSSWGDIAAAATDLAARPAPRPDAVWAGQLGEYEGLVVNVLESLYSALPADRRDLFSAGLPQLREAVDRLRPGGRAPAVTAAALSYDEAASTRALREGRVEALRNWPVEYATLTATSTENPEAGKHIGFCQLPGGATVLGGQNLAVSARSRRPAAAEELIRFLTSAESEEKLFTKGQLAPTRRSAYFGVQPLSLGKAIDDAVNSATPRPIGPCYRAFSNILSQEVHSTLQTGVPLRDDLLDRLQRALDCKPARRAAG